MVDKSTVSPVHWYSAVLALGTMVDACQPFIMNGTAPSVRPDDDMFMMVSIAG